MIGGVRVKKLRDYFDEQLLQEWPDELQEPQDEEEPRELSPPDQEKALMSLRVFSLPQLGHCTSLSRPPMISSSNRSWQLSHWYSYIGTID